MITRISGDNLTHAHLFSIFWGANLFASQVVLGTGGRPEIITLIISFGAWWFFLVGSLLVIKRPFNRSHTFFDLKKTKAIVLLILLIILQWVSISYEVFSYEFWIEGPVFELPTIYPTFRLSGLLSTVDLPWFFEIWRWGYVWYIPLAVILRSKGLISRKFLIGVISLAVLSTLIKFTRAPIIQVGIMALISWILLYRPKPFRKFFLASNMAIFGILLFIAMQIFLILLDPFTRFSPFESMGAYIGGPIKAYEALLQGDFPREGNGFYSFDAINFILFKLSLIEGYPHLVRPFTFIPTPTNLFTYLDAFTLDFGILGALIGSFTIGAIISWFYRKVRTSVNLTSLVIYCYLVYACIMAPMNNEFIRFNLIFSGIVAWILNLIIVKKPDKSITFQHARNINFEAQRRNLAGKYSP